MSGAETVREATLNILRDHDMTRIYCNPGSTEIPFLTDLPEDFQFVLGLHESSLIAMATGEALASRRPVLAQLHTSAGFGNAVAALASARVNRAPLVVIVGQVDRRHLSHQPFLYGDLAGLAGSYPVDVLEPALAQDVPGAVERAIGLAQACGGPVIVIVPMNDWTEAHDPTARASARRVVSRREANYTDLMPLAQAIDQARRPVIVAGAGNDSEAGWSALQSLAERLQAPVWQEAFGPRAGFPQNHHLFAGHLPASRDQLHDVLGRYDLLLVVGTAALRQFPYASGDLIPEGLTTFTITPYIDEAVRSTCDVSIVGDTASALSQLKSMVRPRVERKSCEVFHRSFRADLEYRAEPPAISPIDVYDELARTISPETIIVEETPSSRLLLQEILPAKRPFTYLSGGTGWLGFAVPAAIGIKMVTPSRPVIAVVGDGSALYSIQAFWTAAHFNLDMLFVVLANGGYSVMNSLAERFGGKPPWPGFGDVSISGLAEHFGCTSAIIGEHAELADGIRSAVETLGDARGPRVVEIKIASDMPYRP